MSGTAGDRPAPLPTSPSCPFPPALPPLSPPPLHPAGELAHPSSQPCGEPVHTTVASCPTSLPFLGNFLPSSISPPAKPLITPLPSWVFKAALPLCVCPQQPVHGFRVLCLQETRGDPSQLQPEVETYYKDAMKAEGRDGRGGGFGRAWNHFWSLPTFFIPSLFPPPPSSRLASFASLSLGTNRNIAARYRYRHKQRSTLLSRLVSHTQ